MEERVSKIIEACLHESSRNPIKIFNHIASNEYVRIHGPEHHILDGAALLTAYYNAGGNIDLQSCLHEITNVAYRCLVQLVVCGEFVVQ